MNNILIIAHLAGQMYVRPGCAEYYTTKEKRKDKPNFSLFQTFINISYI